MFYAGFGVFGIKKTNIMRQYIKKSKVDVNKNNMVAVLLLIFIIE